MFAFSFVHSMYSTMHILRLLCRFSATYEKTEN